MSTSVDNRKMRLLRKKRRNFDSDTVDSLTCHIQGCIQENARRKSRVTYHVRDSTVRDSILKAIGICVYFLRSIRKNGILLVRRLCDECLGMND